MDGGRSPWELDRIFWSCFCPVDEGILGIKPGDGYIHPLLVVATGQFFCCPLKKLKSSISLNNNVFLTENAQILSFFVCVGG
jgi:hypothetical protein